jgi:hypothetical protein
VEHYQTKDRSGTSGVADIKWVETVLELDRKEQFTMAYKWLSEDFEKSGGSLSLNDDKFFYFRILSELCQRLGRSNESSTFAKQALELSKITEPQFSRHKTVGLVKSNEDMIERLKRLANNS